jgi:glycosyltransferase involved in cell wall biosynthesis
MVRKMRVSLCMIVRDEEHNLRNCLAPVADLFDEIVIVDTGSRDQTRDIAREFAPHVHEFAWTENFAAARNESLRHATGDWIFWLDADDRVQPEQVEKLRKLFDELDDCPRTFLMNTVLVPSDPREDEWVVTHPRLFRRHPLLHWEGRVHEQLRPDVVSLGYERVLMDLQIDHVGYQDKVVAERKARRKLRLLRMDYAVDPDDTCTLLHLGMALVTTRHMGEARRHLLKLASMRLENWECTRRVYDLLAEIALFEGKPMEAAQFAQCALRLFPDDENLLLALATAHYSLEQYEETGNILERIMRSEKKPHMHFGVMGNIRGKMAPRMLGAVRRMQRQYSQGESVLMTMLNEFPGDVGAWFNLGLIYLDQGLGSKLAPVVQRLMTLPRANTEGGLLAALWHLRRGNPAQAEPIIDELIATSPHLPRPRMLRAECLSRMRAPLEMQIKALRDVLRVQPGNLEAKRWIEAAQKLQTAAVQPAEAAWPSTVVAAPGVAVA